MMTISLSNGHNLKPSLARRSYPFIAAFLAIAIIAALTITLWARNSSEWNDFAPEEVIIDFQAGQNFATKGFLELGFLTDHSLDDAPDAPPVYYTHQPPLPILIIGGLISIGIDDLPGVRLVMILIFLAGLIALMAFFWRLFTPWHGIAIVALLALNGRHVLPLADHTTHAYWLGLTFLTLWAISHPKGRSLFLWIAAASIFLVSLANYIQLIVLLVTLAGLWLIRLPNFTLRRVLFLSAVAAGGIALHVVQNFIVVGPDVAFQDIMLSFGNRIFGEPTREALRIFSQENNLILWGVASASDGSNPFTALWYEYAYFRIPVILSLAGLFTFAFFRRLPSSNLALRLLAVFIIASISFHLLLPAAGQAYYFPFMVAIPIAMVGGLFIGELASVLRQYSLRDYLSNTFPVFLRRYGIFIILIAFAGVSIWQSAALGLRNVNLKSEGTPPVAAELQILQDFQGEGFWTNITPHQVAYYTHSWVIGQMPMEGFKQKDINQAYVIPVSRQSHTWRKVNNPRYFFFAENNVLWFLPDTGPRLQEYRRYLEENYPIVAWSPQRSSFIVDMSIGPVGTSRILEGRQHFDVSQYPRLEFGESQLEVSSINSPALGKANLVRSGTEGFWHVKTPREEDPAWVTVDLMTPEAVALLRLRPRADYTEQLWDGNRAVLRASNDGRTWTALATLGIERAALEDDWVSFQILSTQPYRYYRLSFYGATFLSMGRIELYKLPVSTGTTLPVTTPSPAIPQSAIVNAVQQFDLSLYARIPLDSSQLEVSSVNNPTQGKENLVKPGTGSFWHVTAPREENPAWVTIDLTNQQPVNVLRLKPRTGFTGQLWDGNRAVLYASNNGQDWTPLTTLNIERASLRDDWVYFSLPSEEPFRYFRLSINDMSFFSIARLELYQNQ